MPPHDAHGRNGSHSAPYRRLFFMAFLSFVAMFVLMYAMVDTFANVFANVNQVYMAGLMAAPMVLIELWVMRSMYPSKRHTAVAAGLSVVLFLGCWVGIRQQVAVGDRQFLRSMIPHHAGAILMCREAPINDADIRALCGDIIKSQQEEIARMRAMLQRLE